jgi:hypothetical protein
MDGNENSTDPRSDTPSVGRANLRFFGLLAAVSVAAVVVLALLRYFAGGLPQIHSDDLDRARERWDAADVADYRLTVVLSGRQSGELKVEVRGGRPVGMTRNGTAMKIERTWEPWTVPGMFETLETDFDNAANAEEKFGGGEVVMRAEFDAKYGFPKHYLHQILGRHGDLEWKVTEFTPL